MHKSKKEGGRKDRKRKECERGGREEMKRVELSGAEIVVEELKH